MWLASPASSCPGLCDVVVVIDQQSNGTQQGPISKIVLQNIKVSQTVRTSISQKISVMQTA
jgi:Flp pilus assembly protein CpaB